MKSVDALRKWADGLSCIWIDPNDHSIIVTTCDDMPPSIDSVSLRDHVNGILDGIEREVDDMVPLPVDADGVPIHVGDVMELDSGAVEEVESMHYYGSGGWTTTTTHNATAMPSIIRHHHAPTVDDVLREFAAEVETAGGVMELPDAALAEYAARLRLAGDE